MKRTILSSLDLILYVASPIAIKWQSYTMKLFAFSEDADNLSAKTLNSSFLNHTWLNLNQLPFVNS